jgi:hypothetical protein
VNHTFSNPAAETSPNNGVEEFAMIKFEDLWANHPKRTGDPFPCMVDDVPAFDNQCAIRMGICLEKAGLDLSGFKGARCWHNHKPKHILRAEELANWLRVKLGPSKLTVFKGKDVYLTAQKEMRLKTGIVFFKDAFSGGVDHIDLWNRSRPISDDNYSFAREIWFWKFL